MNRTALLLVLISCTTHAGWNLLVKRANATPAFFWVAGVVVVLAAAPAFCLGGGARVLNAPPLFWRCLLVTGFWQAAYFLCLATAYRTGDVSVVYPLARSSPLFVLPLAGLLQNQWPTSLASVGIALAVAGCFFLPRQSLRLRSEGWQWKDYAAAASLWALAAALASSGYTVTDAIGMAAIKRAMPGMQGAFLYGYLEWISTTLWLAGPVLLREGRRGVAGIWNRERPRVLVVSALIFVTYWLVLWAYALTDKVAYVAGIRQFSIVLGVLGGLWLFKDPGGWVRMLGALMIAGGLVLIALAR